VSSGGGSAMNRNARLLLRAGERLDDLQRAGLRIIQNPDLYAFSVDSVLLASFARAKHRDVVVDLGTGTGVIPLLMWARWRPARIIAIEVQPQLADMARRSVVLNDLEDEIEIVEGDIRDVASRFDHSKVDVVVCNPPYRPVGRGPKPDSPVLGIAHAERMFTLSDLAAVASRILKSSGRLVVVYRPERLAELIFELTQKRLEPKRVRFVNPMPSRPAKMVLLEAVKDGGKQLSVLPPLFIHSQDGSYTPEIMRLYSETDGSGEG